MFSILLLILPIFALIGLGWAARRSALFGPHATTELNRFVVYMALPALLFDIVAHARWAQVWQPGFIAVFGLSAFGVFALTVAVRARRGRLADAALEGLNAGYANTAFIGFPLTLSVLGQGALVLTTIASILTVCVLFATAIILVELGVQAGKPGPRLFAKVALSVGRNPLVIAPALGAVVAASGLGVPAPAETVLKMLGGAASPCALVALGLFLGAPKAVGAARSLGTAGVLVALKLLLQPLVAFALAALFHLPPGLTRAAVLLAALPTGTGPFMLAEFYKREARTTSDVILASTLGSLVTVSAYLAISG